MAFTEFKGVIVPILTPLTPDERVDIVSLQRLVNYLVGNGVHGIWAAGTTGEFAALSDEQRLVAIETVVDTVKGRVPVIGNISAPGTAIAVGLGLGVREMGLDGVAATPPYYYPNAQDELVDHYRHLSDRVGMPLWIYNIPVTVKTVVEPHSIIQLAGEGTVVGIKDSSGAGEPFAHLKFLCEQSNIHLWRFLGSVFRTTTARALGAHGVIPGVANLVPALFTATWEAGERGDGPTALEHTARLAAATRIMSLASGGGQNASSVSGLKSALRMMGILESDTVTRPFRPLTEAEKKPIPNLLQKLGLLDQEVDTGQVVQP